MHGIVSAKSNMSYRFNPAAPDEEIVYGACRPCYSWFAGENTTVGDWIAFMRDQDIERVCCLLDAKLDEYDDLLARYRQAFGSRYVCHAPVPDYEVIDRETLHDTVLPFLAAGVAARQRTVVHCSAGQGRTGHVLALWLATARDYTIGEAVETVQNTGRSPLESDASLETLADLLREEL